MDETTRKKIETRTADLNRTLQQTNLQIDQLIQKRAMILGVLQEFEDWTKEDVAVVKSDVDAHPGL